MANTIVNVRLSVANLSGYKLWLYNGSLLNTGGDTLTVVAGDDSGLNYETTVTEAIAGTVQGHIGPTADDNVFGPFDITLADDVGPYEPLDRLAIITGTDGVTLATTQGNYAPAKARDQMDLIDAPNETAVTALATAIWNRLTSTMTVAGSIGKLIIDQFLAVLSAVSAVSLSGPYTITVTIDDGTTNLNGATVRFSNGVNAETKTTATINAVAGRATFLAINDNWDITVFKPGYSSNSSSITVEGADQSVTISLTQITQASPSSPGLCRVGVYVESNNAASVGAVFSANLLGSNQASDGIILTQSQTATTDANGYAYLDLVRLDQFAKGTGKYQLIVRDSTGNLVYELLSTIPNASTYNLEDMLT